MLARNRGSLGFSWWHEDDGAHIPWEIMGIVGATGHFTIWLNLSIKLAWGHGSLVGTDPWGILSPW